MAKPTLTSLQGRSSAINVQLPFGRTLPPADSAIDIYDRQHNAFSFTSNTTLNVYVEPHRYLYWNSPPHVRQTTLNYMAVVDGVTAPTEGTPGYAILFVDSADGDLKIIFADGTTKTIVTDT